MSHKTIQMTVRYAHLAPQYKLAAVEKLCEPVEVEKAEATKGAAPETPADTRTDTSTSEAVLGQSSAVQQAIAAQSLTA